MTKKDKNHRVKANKDSWCFTLRGPWDRIWTEYEEFSEVTTFFTHGRKILGKTEGK